MKSYFNYISLFFALLLCNKLYSQNYPKENVRLKDDIWFGFNAQISPNKLNREVGLDSNFVSENVFLIQVFGKHSTMEMTESNYFYQKSLYTTYERLFSPKWIGGLSYRYSELNINTNTLRGHLRHYSLIKKIDLTFWQQVAFERILSNNSFYKSVSRLRFQFAVNKQFILLGNNFKRKLTGTISFELFKELQRLNSTSERRFFQEQRIQTEWFFQVHKNVHLGAFAGFHTKKFVALAQYNIAGEELKPIRRLNQQLPIFGINIISTLGKNSISNNRLWIE